MKIAIKAILGAAAALALGASSGLAANYTITTAATADWNITTNWTPNTPSTSEPGAADSVIFTNPAAEQFSQFITTRSITNLTANNTANTISLRGVGSGTGGQTLTITGTLDKTGAGAFYIGGGFAPNVNVTRHSQCERWHLRLSVRELGGG